jgi:hypothetical protein
MAVRKTSPIAGHKGETTCPAELIDEMLSQYIAWRRRAGAVADAYQHWSGSPADEKASRFSAYLAALDLEEASAKSYAVVVADVGRFLIDAGQPA